jgi:dihydroorotate dehydrogenase (fumarate)
MKLKNPLVASSSPLCKDIDNIKRLEDGGVSAVVLHSLFEEQIQIESIELDRGLSAGAESFAESLSYFPNLMSYNVGPDGYIEHVRKAKQSVGVPVWGSLNGVTATGWVRYAKMIQDAGADALELNIYFLPTNPDTSGDQLEQQYCDLVRQIKANLTIPVAVKLGPSFTSIPHIARALVNAGADGLVLFNRFYQPDMDLETLDVVPNLVLSNSSELLKRLHWVAILYGKVNADLAITGGVHTAADVLKSMMAGAKIAQTTSFLLRKGPAAAAEILRDLEQWMEDHEYESIQQMQGSMSYQSVADVSAFERANYMKVLSSYALRSSVV